MHYIIKTLIILSSLYAIFYLCLYLLVSNVSLEMINRG